MDGIGTILSVGTLVLAILIILIEALICARRGAVRTLWRMLTLLPVMIIAFVLTVVLAEPAYKLIAGFIVSVDGSPSATELTEAVVASFGIEAEGLQPLFADFTYFFAAFLKPFLFVVFFWILLLLSWPVFALCWKLTHREKKTEETNGEEEETVVKTVSTQSRLLGAVLGIVTGIIIGAITFMPINKVSDYAGLVKAESVESLGAEDVVELAGFWNTAPASYVYKFTGTEAAGEGLYALLARKSADGKVYKTEYITEVLALADEALQAAEIFTEGETADLEKSLDAAESLVEKAFDLQLLSEESKKAIVGKAFCLVCNTLLAAEDGSAAGEMEDKLIAKVDDLTAAELKKDLTGTLDLVLYVNEIGLLEGDFKDAFENITEETADELAERIYKLNVAEVILPYTINMLLETALAEIGVTIQYPAGIDNFEETQDEFADLLVLVADLLSTLNGNVLLSDVSQINEEIQRFKELGNSSFIAEDTYKELEKQVVKSALEQETAVNAVNDAVDKVLDDLQTEKQTEYDAETREQVQTAVTDYLKENEDITMDDITEVLDGLDSGDIDIETWAREHNVEIPDLN